MKKGFTLIELLVVIAIIALLSTLSVVALNSARVKSRDARRLSDIKQIRTALEMYFDTNDSYPNANLYLGDNDDVNCLKKAGFSFDINCSDSYMKISGDPSVFSYFYDGTESSYNLTYHLEGTNQDYIATPATMGY